MKSMSSRAIRWVSSFYATQPIASMNYNKFLARRIFCRDRGWMGGRAGALCLSLCAAAIRLWQKNANESCGNEDRHNAPALPPIHPLSLQDEIHIITGFDC